MKKNWPAFVILAAYLVVGTLYAIYTPKWQIPDEPAHYNYIRSLAEGRGFPVMAQGDYDQDYLSRLTSEKFPPELSVEGLEYEDHQPPLYYLLAVPVYLAFDGSVKALRLFSLAWGGVAVAMVMLIMREFLPERPGVAWLGVGAVAFIPQFVAMMAGTNNDSLTLALLWLWLWLALRYLRGKTAPWVLGLALGAMLITKATGYGALLLAGMAVSLRHRREGQPFRWAVRQALFILIPALFLGGLWWLRNVNVYGWPDVMGQMQHNEVVIGQPRTEDWIARDGALPFLTSALRTTFQSFWGQFGWMGVVLDERIYRGALIFSVLILWGAFWRLREIFKTKLESRQRDGLLLIGASAGITLAIFLFYNLTYVQHQGRYLFPALPLMALAAAFGLERLTERRLAIVTALILVVTVAVLGVVGLLRRDMPFWSMALVGGGAAGLVIATAVPERWRFLPAAGLIAGLVALDVWCLFGFIVPALAF
ncbi:MAG: DUF2142 domain-containing protein [Anaerolineae bacterium]|nr:DUF2142 domain-containing protein [Anaerolineae bacterium]